MIASARTKRDLNRIIPFGLIWMLSAFIYVLLEKGLLYDLEFYPSTGNPYAFGINTLITVLVATVSGLLIGTLEIRVLNGLFTRQSFGKKILFKTGIYILLMILFVIIVSAIGHAVKLDRSLFDEQIWANIWKFLSSITFWTFQLYLAAMIGWSLFYSEVSENLGPSVLYNFFVGKYHRPIQEERIFMFLDMKSSTTLAEEMGDVRYFEMLQEYYIDLSDPILLHYGEVYQYVGDEIIVSWKLGNGVKDNNCLKCFFAMKDALEDLSEKYRSEFGLVPSFKAGIHYGNVTAGEIGVLKKDITFSGDVLNTTARIQGLCNGYDVDLLISKDLTDLLDLSSGFQVRSMGTNELRGRREQVELFTVGPTGDPVPRGES